MISSLSVVIGTRNRLEILKKCLDYMFQLDKLGYTKEEMHHPHKHILINEHGKIKLIDFERCRRTEKPKNLTQFCQFLTSTEFGELLKKKRINIDPEKIKNLTKNYKRTYSESTLKKIKQLF